MAKLLGSSVVVALVASVYAQTNFSACPVIPDGYKFTDPSRKCSSVSPAIADTATCYQSCHCVAINTYGVGNYSLGKLEWYDVPFYHYKKCECTVYPGSTGRNSVQFTEDTCESDVYLGNLVLLLFLCCCGCCSGCACCYYAFVHVPHRNRMAAAAATVQVTPIYDPQPGSYVAAGAPPAYDATPSQSPSDQQGLPPSYPEFDYDSPTAADLSGEDDTELMSVA